MSQEYDKSRFFDLILLDPPWENRSAKRHAAYETHSVQNLVEEMDLANYLQPGGLVGIWVTNKSAHHELVLGSGGIFQSLNVSLIEEWIWIKTTSNGEPVTQLDGIWRKPYEVLLLGRAPESRLQIVQPAEKVSRRVIAGVPDFHSRKPCLKTLIEPFLPKEYQALEVFARYLVQGWTSWGNEVLKYNYEGYYENGDP
jgi:N6-adenosine-specific RNA methylase IME4